MSLQIIYYLEVVLPKAGLARLVPAKPSLGMTMKKICFCMMRLISFHVISGWPRFMPSSLRDSNNDTFKQLTNDKALFGPDVGNNITMDLDMTWVTSATKFKVTVTSQTEMFCGDEAGIMVCNFLYRNRSHFDIIFYSTNGHSLRGWCQNFVRPPRGFKPSNIA